MHSGAAVPTPDAPQPRGPSRMQRRHAHGEGSSSHAAPALPITQATRLPLWKAGRQCLTYIASAQTRASTQAIQLGHDALPQDITHYRARRRARRIAAPETKSAAPTSRAWTSATADMESSAVLGIAEVEAEGAGFTVSGVGAGAPPSEAPGVSGLSVSPGV